MQGEPILSKEKRDHGYLDRDTPGLKEKLKDAIDDEELSPEMRALARVLLREHPSNKRCNETEYNEETYNRE